MINGVDFAIVSVDDVEAARRFYGEVLGLAMSKQWGELPMYEYETGSLTLAVGDTTSFGLRHSTNANPIALHVDDFEAAKSALAAAGVQFEADTIDSGVCHMIPFRDPAGNALMIHSRYAH